MISQIIGRKLNISKTNILYAGVGECVMKKSTEVVRWNRASRIRVQTRNQQRR